MKTITVCVIGIVAITIMTTSCIITIGIITHDKELTRQYELKYNNCSK